MMNQKEQSTIEPALLRANEVARFLGCSRQHIHNMTKRGDMPKPIKLASAVRWRRKDLERWIAEKETHNAD